MTIKELKHSFSEKIPANEIDILLSFVLDKDKVFLYTHPEYKIQNNKIGKLRELISRRIKGEPIAYLVGHKEFYGLDFIVNKHTLVPRPETELMVDEALRIAHNSQHITLIDVGTGSGCIIISIAKMLAESRIKNHESRFIGVDISSTALSVAKKNAFQNKVDKFIKFQKSDLLKNIHNSLFMIHDSILILANLPYLNPSQIKDSPSIKKEPRLALVAGSDGLKYYRKLFKQISYLSKQTSDTSPLSSRPSEAPPLSSRPSEAPPLSSRPSEAPPLSSRPSEASGGIPCNISKAINKEISPLRSATVPPLRRTSEMTKREIIVLCEIDPSQKNSIKTLIKKELPTATFQIKKDLKGHSRLVIISITR